MDTVNMITYQDGYLFPSATKAYSWLREHPANQKGIYRERTSGHVLVGDFESCFEEMGESKRDIRLWSELSMRELSCASFAEYLPY